jgi:integral membrane sensor domain MASE1
MVRDGSAELSGRRHSSTTISYSVPRRLRQDFTTWIRLAAIYTLAGKLGLALALVSPSATAVWPPSGIALAAVLIFGPRVWPGIFLGAFLTNELTAGTVATSLLIAAGNTLEALLGGYLVTRFAGGRATFDHARTIFLFVLLAGFVSTSVSATIGATTLSLFEFGPWSAYWPTWVTWWLLDAPMALARQPISFRATEKTACTGYNRQHGPQGHALEQSAPAGAPAEARRALVCVRTCV